MEIQFQKSVVPYLRTVIQQRQNQEQTQQVRLSDAMPDIGKVLSAWGQILLRGKEWRNDSFLVSGGVKTWVLYAPEDGAKPYCVESWLPFQMKWDIPDTEQDGTIIVCPAKAVVDARMLSDRKLMVRANVALDAWALIRENAVISTPEESECNLQTLKNTYPMLLPAEAGEKAFELEESLTLPMTEQPVETLIRSTLEPQITESKLVGDKLVMRGTVHIHFLYMGTDSQLHHWSADIPFSQFAQLDDTYGQNGETLICVAVTELETELTPEGDLYVKAGLAAQYIVYDRRDISVVEDMYCVNRQMDLQKQELRLPAVLDMQQNALRAEAESKNLPGGILDAEFVPDAPEVCREGDRLNAHLCGTFQLLGIDGEGNLASEICRWEDDWSGVAAEDDDYRMQIQTVEKPQFSGTTVRTEVPFLGIATQQQPIGVVTDANMGAEIQQDPNRPSLILRRPGEDSLWELAKQTGSTVEQIRKINGLTQEPGEDQMLLIPVS